MRQRHHEKSKNHDQGTSILVDYYPAIDCFIPESERIASMFHEKTIKKMDWSLMFLDAMDYLTAKNGLRVITTKRLIKLHDKFRRIK